MLRSASAQAHTVGARSWPTAPTAPAAPAADVRALLESCVLFRGLSPRLIDDLARRLQVRTRVAGAQLAREGEPGDAMFIILSGRVRAAVYGESGREVILSVHGKGDFFGEMALLDGGPRSAHVTAMEDTTLVILTRDALHDHLRSHPQTALNLLGELARRLRRADQTIAALALHDVSERLVATLTRLAREEGREEPDGLLLLLRPTQQELAFMIGACRETVSRMLASFNRRGLIVQKGRGLLISKKLVAP